MIRKLSELGLTGLEDFQDKSGEGRFGVSSIRDSASQHLPCVDRDRHGFDDSLWLSYVYLNDFTIPKINLHNSLVWQYVSTPTMRNAVRYYAT